MIGDSFYSSQKSALITLSLFLLLSAAAAHAQTTSFTYQGRLTDSNNPANGNYDLQFALFDNSSGGTQIGATQTVSTVSVSGGVFTVQLDFGVSAFPGASRFLEIGVRPSGGGSFSTLSPRQPISSTPYAIRSLNASSADAVTVNGVPRWERQLHSEHYEPAGGRQLQHQRQWDSGWDAFIKYRQRADAVQHRRRSRAFCR